MSGDSVNAVAVAQGARAGSVDTASRGLWSWIAKKSRSIGLQRIDLVLPSGLRLELGVGGGAIPLVRLVRWSAVVALMRRGANGFAEAFMDGSIETDDLAGLFEYFTRNEAALLRLLPTFNRTTYRDRVYHLRRRNTRRGSRRNIAAHYDLGNSFYKRWLDESMLYSSGIYRSAEDTLEAAQQHKLRAILEALDIRPGSTVMEIGCGWGTVAVGMAKAGARVRAITISAEQQDWARKSVAEHAVEDQVDVVFEDYRDTAGTFDRIVSIEMIEAVGEENWPRYFETLYERLAPGGSAVIQAITIAPDLYDRYRRNPDFIQRYVFPGGMLPTVDHMRRNAHWVGLTFETVEEFGRSYERTLADWRVRFEAAWPEISALGYDERFRRLWLYYLVYCEIGFRQGSVNVGLYRISKPAGKGTSS